MGRRVLAVCDELWLCGPRLSGGMKAEMAEAETLGIPLVRVPAEHILQKPEQSQGSGFSMQL